MHHAGYFLGENLYPPRNTNPKGFFENDVINGINEKIMMPYDSKHLQGKYGLNEKRHSPFNPGYGHRWLSYIQKDIKVELTDKSLIDEIQLAVTAENFAYKDPRFNYTLEVWMPYLRPSVTFICMFREPDKTMQSVVDECRTADYLSDFQISLEVSEELWCQSYSRLLRTAASNRTDDFIFIHYRQLLSGEVIPGLSDRLEVNLSADFADRQLDRTRTSYVTGTHTNQLYQHLCDLANYKPQLT